MLWRHLNDTFSWVDAVYLRDSCIILLFSRTVRLLKNTNGYPNKVWEKRKTTWAVGIAQLTYHSVRGGGKNPSTFGPGISVPTLNLVVS